MGCTGESAETSSRQADSLSHVAASQDTTQAEENEEPEVKDPADQQVFRGFLAIVPGRQSFQACGTMERSWIVDLTGQELADVYQTLAINTGDPVFIEIVGLLGPAPEVGFGAEYANQIKVLELRRAELEGPGCNEMLDGVEFRARGNEPFWRLDITANGIVFSDFGRSLKLQFPYAKARTSPGRWRYSSKGEGEQRIKIDIEQEPCRDTMSGAYSTLKAEIEVDGRTYLGCAIKGARE